MAASTSPGRFGAGFLLVVFAASVVAGDAPVYEFDFDLRESSSSVDAEPADPRIVSVHREVACSDSATVRITRMPAIDDLMLQPQVVTELEATTAPSPKWVVRQQWPIPRFAWFAGIQGDRILFGYKRYDQNRAIGDSYYWVDARGAISPHQGPVPKVVTSGYCPGQEGRISSQPADSPHGLCVLVNDPTNQRIRWIANFESCV